MAYRIIVDAGHGGYDNGAIYNGNIEKDENLQMALAVGEILSNNGFEVVFTRTTDVYQNPNEKAMMANESGANLFLSIHRNSSPYPNTYSGFETLIYNLGDVKEKFAQNINAKLAEVGFNNLGVNVRQNLAVLKRTNIPAALVEVGFINSDEDNILFRERFHDIANAIVLGIIETVGGGTEGSPLYYYRIQVGLYTNYNNALNLQQQLLDQGYDADIVRMGDYYAVVVGRFNSIQQAGEMKQELTEGGYDTLVIAL